MGACSQCLNKIMHLHKQYKNEDRAEKEGAMMIEKREERRMSD